MRLARDRRGIAAFEFAMIAPVIAGFMVGIAEVSTALRIKHRLDSTSQQIGQVVSQCNVVSMSDTTQFWAEAEMLLKGATKLANGGGAVIISAVYKEGTTNPVTKVGWQVRKGDGSFTSAIGAAGGTANLPAGFSPPGEHVIIVTEAFSHVQPLVLGEDAAKRMLGDTLSATTLTISRALDPVVLRQLSTEDKMKCTS